MTAESAGPETLNWSEIGKLIEGLAYAGRPIFQATESVKQQYGLGPRGSFILNLVSEGVDLPKDLATMLKASRSLITADLLRLTEAGLLTSTADAKDRRSTRLALTDGGKKLCQSIRDEMARIVVSNLKNYSVADIRLFTAMLQDVRGAAV